MNATAAQILLHYYATPSDYKNFNEMSKSDKEALRFLQKDELIDTNHDLTPRGICLVEHWLDTPLPQQTWEVLCG